MSRNLDRASYENLIKQIVFIEENIEGICRAAAATGFFASAAAAEEFFNEYIGKVESLFKDIKIVEKEALRLSAGQDGLPFIVLDSSFTLAGADTREYCHLSPEVWRKGKGPVKHLYFLSDAGLKLLLKQQGESVETDIGEGIAEYRVGSISIK